MPDAHAVQTRSPLEVPDVDTNVPAPQSLQSEHELSLVPLVKVPDAHAAQVRSLEALPAAET